MFNFDKIPPNEFAILGTLLGVLLNQTLDVKEQNSFGNFLVSVGQTMLTAAAQSENQQAHNINQKHNNLCAQIDQINCQLNLIKDSLKNKK